MAHVEGAAGTVTKRKEKARNEKSVAEKVDTDEAEEMTKFEAVE